MIGRFFLMLGLVLSSGVQAEILNIGSAELERLAGQGVPVVDIRTEAEWRSTGVIAGSRALTFFDAQGRADAPRWLKQAGAFAAPGQPLILICRSGNRSRAVAEYLSGQAGFTRVYNVVNGIQGWAGERRPLISPSPACLAGGIC